MKRILEGRQPEAVLRFFEEICAIPHGSGNVKEISNYLVSFAERRQLKYRQDEKYNVIIWKDGTAGYENREPVILQGHMDMVAVKDPDVDKDMEKEGLDLEISGDMLSAAGTSLGGDDGIGVAYGLAVLDSRSLSHPPIEAVFTVDEEIGMLGASFIELSDLKGRLMINLDSEIEGIFTVSCAGGAAVTGLLPISKEESAGSEKGEKEASRHSLQSSSAAGLLLRIAGLKGGHSGMEIKKGTLNANIAMGRILYELSEDVDFRLIEIAGGEKDNAIPVSCQALLALSPAAAEESCAAKTGGEENADLKEAAARAAGRALQIMEQIREEYACIEDSMIGTAEVINLQKEKLTTKESTRRVIAALMNHPNGIQRMSSEIPDMVQTSLNLGIVRTYDSHVTLTSAVRSSVETEKSHLINRIRSLMEILGGRIEIEGDYPGWAYRPESRLRNVMVGTYKEIYGKEPSVEGVHAGLECGIFAAKLPGLDAISIGPQLYEIHTSREHLELNSVRRTWELLVKTLEKL